MTQFAIFNLFSGQNISLYSSIGIQSGIQSIKVTQQSRKTKTKPNKQNIQSIEWPYCALLLPPYCFCPFLYNLDITEDNWFIWKIPCLISLTADQSNSGYWYLRRQTGHLVNSGQIKIDHTERACSSQNKDVTCYVMERNCQLCEYCIENHVQISYIHAQKRQRIDNRGMHSMASVFSDISHQSKQAVKTKDIFSSVQLVIDELCTPVMILYYWVQIPDFWILSKFNKHYGWHVGSVFSYFDNVLFYTHVPDVNLSAFIFATVS